METALFPAPPHLLDMTIPRVFLSLPDPISSNLILPAQTKLPAILSRPKNRSLLASSSEDPKAALITDFQHSGQIRCQPSSVSTILHWFVN